jgi:membrane-associated phospholipid phosphatase
MDYSIFLNLTLVIRSSSFVRAQEFSYILADTELCMKRSTVITFFIVLFLLFSNAVNSQNVYKLNKKTESIHIATGLVLNGVGLALLYDTPDLTSQVQLGLDRQKVSPFDRYAFDKRSNGADRLSDFLAYGSAVLPVITYGIKHRDAHWRNASVMYFETAVYNLALTNIIKYSVRRKRPYVYSEILSQGEVYDHRGSASFYSGHTSFASSNAWFAALIFHDAFPDSQWVPVMYGAAIVVPVSTGIARVYAGEHFPTDVLVGYIMGAATAVAVVCSHRDERLKIDTNGTVLRLTYALD